MEKGYNKGVIIMKIKDLIKKLKEVDSNLEVSIIIENGRGVSISKESVGVSWDKDGVYIGGEEEDYN